MGIVHSRRLTQIRWLIPHLSPLFGKGIHLPEVTGEPDTETAWLIGIRCHWSLERAAKRTFLSGERSLHTDYGADCESWRFSQMPRPCHMF